MDIQGAPFILTTCVAALVLWRARRRLQLSLAKHPSMQGHAKMARFFSRMVPFYEYGEDAFFSVDGAPSEVAERRAAGFRALAAQMRDRSPESEAASRELEMHLSDLQFVNAYRVPFQFRSLVARHLATPVVYAASGDRRLQDLDGHWHDDLAGSYGLNVFGYEAYKRFVESGVEKTRALGPVLGVYHPLVGDNAARLKAISGMDEVSFHMSGTEAVMQAVRLARYHSGRSHLVRFCGAYHGWWDGVQPGVGNPRAVGDAYTLKDMSRATLEVLRTRGDIACVLINPVQAMHPNANAPADSFRVGNSRMAPFDRAAYAAWLQEVRQVCTERSIALIMDEVFVGFRLAYGGAQEYFGVRADMVTYGKTLGGGLPVGVLCGKSHWMRRYREKHPADICFARGTFNSHPYVMGAMNEFLRYAEGPQAQQLYAGADAHWQRRMEQLNAGLAAVELPLRLAHMGSIATFVYTVPSRYNWMLQFYLRAEGLHLSWVGTGRLVFDLDLPDDEFARYGECIARAAQRMRDDGWWWCAPGQSNGRIGRQIAREMLLRVLRCA